MIQFSLFGIPVRVEPIFWLTLALIGGGLSARDSESLLVVALFVLAGFVSVLIHEMGHALMIRKFKLPTQVVLAAFGGYATYPPGILTRKQSFIVTAAGPGIQLVFGIAVLIISSFLPLEPSHLVTFIRYLIGVSIIWALFNCLPIYPMDGGQMLASILGPRRVRAVHITGLVCAALIAVLALMGRQVFIAVFMGLFAWQNYQLLQQNR